MTDFETTQTAWSAERVRDRVVEAFQVERRLPGQGFTRKTTSSWPVAPLHTFTEVMHWTDARQRVWENWAQAKGALPHEVSMMDEAFCWLGWLEDGERRCLAAWCLATARDMSVSAILRQKSWHRTTFYRKRDQGAARIADRLNREGVQVR